MFSLSLCIVQCYNKPLLTKSKMLQLIIPVLVICGWGLLVVINGFIPILSPTFRPKSALILLPLFWLPKGKSRSPCPHLSMEALAWLASAMIFSTNPALPIVIYFEPIVVVDNERFYILVRLVSVDWYICQDGYLLSVISPKRSGQVWCLFIIKVSWEIFFCSWFNYFARVLFNFSRIWFNCFDRNYTLILLIFV